MRRILGAALGIALLATGAIHGDQSAPPAPRTVVVATAAISGVVTDAATGKPMIGASVTLSAVPRQSLTRPSAVTDARGRFVFVNLPSAPQYSLFASGAGYSGGSYEGTAPAGHSVSIKLADGEWMRDADIRMSRSGSIGGRVVDERGDPVVGAAIRIFSRRYVASRQQLVEGPVTSTDDRGVYRFAFPPSGSLLVAVLSVQATVPASIADGPRRLPLGGLEGRGGRAAPDVSGASIDVDGRHRLVLTNFATPPPAGADGPRAYPPIFYPNARTVADAQSIDLEVGATGTNVDFQLAPVPTASVSGRLTGVVEGAANMLLRLMTPGTEALGFGAEAATTLVEADETFTFLNVPPGTYTLVASSGVAEVAGGGSSQGNLPRSVGYGSVQGLSAMYPSGPNVMWWQSAAGAAVWGQMPVSVGTADITGLGLPLHRAASVRGRVVFDDSVSLQPGDRFDVTLEPANADPSLGAPNAFTAADDDSHSFTIEGLRGGRYLVRFLFLMGWRVESVMANGMDLVDAGFDGTLGSNYDDVVIKVTKSGAELSGAVRDRSGRPASGDVILFPIDPKLWVDCGLTPDRLRSASVNADGTYRIVSLRDGEYYVAAIPSAQSGAWMDPKFLAAATAEAMKVSLTNRATKTQDLHLSKVIVK